MAKIRVKKENVEEIQNQLKNARDLLEDATNDIWGKNFDNLYNNMIANHFLDDLYEDAKSRFNLLFGLGTTIVGGGGAILSGTAAATAASGVTLAGVAACIPVAGWIIAAVILAILGIVGIAYMIKSASDVNFLEDAKKVLADLLAKCWGGTAEQGTEPNYEKMQNLDTKLESVRLTLTELLLKVDEFNAMYANLQEAAASVEMSGKMKLASDGVTVLDMNTEVTIDGEKATVSVSDAMNAFFTYESTVMAAEIEASYMEQTYGVNINYTDLVKNANAFMTDTFNSNLYSHEFVNGVLPSYEADYGSAVDLAAGTLGISTSEFTSALDNNSDVAGAVAGVAGLVGAAFLGTLIKEEPQGIADPTTGSGDTSGGNPSGGNNSGGNSNGGNANGGNSNGTNGNNGGNSGGQPKESTTTDFNKDSDGISDIVNPKDKEENENKENKDSQEGKEEGTNKEPEENTEENPKDPEKVVIELEKVIEEELPEEIFPELGDKDYDAIAREEYESKGLEELETYRATIVEETNALFDGGEVDKIKEKLTEYGYAEEEVNLIISDREALITAVLVGDQKKSLLELVQKQTLADAVTDYDSMYDDVPTYQSIQDGTESTILVSLESSEEVVAAKAEVSGLKEEYLNSIEDTNTALKEYQEAKEAMVEVQNKYTEEFGEDTEKWSQEALEEYNEVIHKYNEQVGIAKEKIEKTEGAKEAFTNAEENYQQIKAQYLEEIKKQNDKTTSPTPSIEPIPETPTTPVPETPVESAPIVEGSVPEESIPADTGISADADGVIHYPDEQALKDLLESYKE